MPHIFNWGFLLFLFFALLETLGTNIFFWKILKTKNKNEKLIIEIKIPQIIIIIFLLFN